MTLRVSPDELVEADSSGVLGVHESWERVRLKEVALVQNGFAFKSESFSKGKGFPLLRIRDVGANSPETHIDGEVDAAYIVNRGDIVIGMDGDFRVARWEGPPAALNQRVCRVVRTSASYNERFLFHALQPYLDAVNRATSAITVKHLSSATVGDLPLPLPPLAEQGRIVAAIEEAFSKLDAGEAGLRNVRQLLKRMRAAILSAAVTGRLVPQDSTDNPATKLLTDLGVEPVESSEARGPDLAGWANARLGDLAAVVSGNTPKGLAESLQGGGDVPFLKVGDLPASAVSVVDSRTWIRCEEASSLGVKLYPSGTILFPKRGGAIATNRKCILGREAGFDLNTMGLVPKPGLGRWLWAWVLQLDLRTIADGSNVPQINHTDVAPLNVPIPPSAEQARIVAEVERQMSIIDACERSIDGGLEVSAALRRSVLKVAFEGRLVPQDPTDEPASVLLEQIRAERAASPTPTPKKRRARSTA